MTCHFQKQAGKLDVWVKFEICKSQVKHKQHVFNATSSHWSRGAATHTHGCTKHTLADSPLRCKVISTLPAAPPVSATDGTIGVAHEFGKINVESNRRAPLSPRVQPSDCDDRAAMNKRKKSLAV